MALVRICDSCKKEIDKDECFIQIMVTMFSPSSERLKNLTAPPLKKNLLEMMEICPACSQKVHAILHHNETDGIDSSQEDVPTEITAKREVMFNESHDQFTSDSNF